MSHIQNVILSGLRFGPPSRWAEAFTSLCEDNFVDERRLLYLAFKTIYQRTGHPVTEETFDLALSAMKDKSQAAELRMAWDELKENPDDGYFMLAIHQLCETHLDISFNSAIATALEINTRGAIVDGKRLEGRDAAKQYLLHTLPEIRTVGDMALSDATAEGDQVLKEYEQAKLGSQPGTRSYIPSVDRVMVQLEPGDLLLLLGYTGEGKTQLCMNFAHNNVVNGKNVLYVTTETVRERIRRRFFSRHSLDPKFSAKLPYADIKHGSLSVKQEGILRDIVTELTSQRLAGIYGGFYIINAFKGLSDISTRVEEVRRLAGSIDLVVIDYLALMATSFERINLVEIIQECKSLAVDLRVPVITPWQTSVAAWELAKKRGYYSKGAMSETTEAEKSADFVLTMLRDPDDSSRLLMKFTKCRDEAEGEPFDLSCDYAYSWIGEPRVSAGNINF